MTPSETLARWERIRQLHEKGATPQQIAARLGMSAGGIAERLRRMGLEPNRGGLEECAT